MSDPGAQSGNATPFVEIDRGDWAALSPRTTAPLTRTEIIELRGLGDELDLVEVEEVYLPLSRLLSLYAKNAQNLHTATSAFLA